MRPNQSLKLTPGLQHAGAGSCNRGLGFNRKLKNENTTYDNERASEFTKSIFEAAIKRYNAAPEGMPSALVPVR